MQLGTYSNSRRKSVFISQTHTRKISSLATLYCHSGYLQSCFDIFIVVFIAPFSLKSLFFFGTVQCGCLVKIKQKSNEDKVYF